MRRKWICANEKQQLCEDVQTGPMWTSTENQVVRDCDQSAPQDESSSVQFGEALQPAIHSNGHRYLEHKPTVPNNLAVTRAVSEMASGDDMQRLGVFKEMSYITVGDKFTSCSNRPFNESAYRGRQMQAGVAKHKCALQSGFFDSTYRRIFEHEAESDPVRLERQYRIEQSKKNLSKAFLPCSGAKNPCGSGSYHGTLTQPVEAMSPLLVSQKVHRSPGRNFTTSPAKRGSGYSYPNVTLSRRELYAPDPYDRAKEVLKREAAIHESKCKNGPFTSSLHPRDYFQSNPYRSHKPLPPAHKPLPATQARPPVAFKPSSLAKKTGGMKAGTFGAYPLHSTDPYVIRQAKRSQAEPVFRPASGPKSTPVKSIITVNTNRSVNSANYASRIPAVMVF